MVKLLALIRAKTADLELVDKALTAYVRRLDQFFDRRQRSPSDELRRDVVAALKKLRLTDATGAGASIGLERLLGQYMIRNTKSLQERKYYFVNKTPAPASDQATGSPWRYEVQAFNKLDDLRSPVAVAPLIPFDGADALFYLQLRRVIQDTIDRAREHEDGQHTFITTDLRQGLSSYPQIASSSLLAREMESAKRLRRIVDRWNSKGSLRLHPKVRAVIDVVREIAFYELKKLHAAPDSWISKVLVFNQLIEGTAVQLRQQIEAALDPIFENALGFELSQRGLGTRQALVARTRAVADRAIGALAARISQKFGEASKVPSVFQDQALRNFAGRSIVQIMAERCARAVDRRYFCSTRRPKKWPEPTTG